MDVKKKEGISVLGSTGSIGINTLEILKRLKQRYTVVGLAAGRNVELLLDQILQTKPKIVSVESEKDAEWLKSKCGKGAPEILFGSGGAEKVASANDADVVVSAITGIAGLGPTLAAVKKGKRVALANKESMVSAGPLIREMAEKNGAKIIPVDSEHSGVFQCLSGINKEDIEKVILTASGGPFFRSSKEELAEKTLEEALNHPRWKMGEKVTVDSATMMNKGLELIEAHWLFDVKPDKLDVLIHPQSIVHALVILKDGSILAQLSATDMKIPIQYALTYPARISPAVSHLNLSEVGKLEFYPVDQKKFPLVDVARRVMEEGGSAPIALNAANEVANNAFRSRKIVFTDISAVVIKALEKHVQRPIKSLEDIYFVDRETRRQTRNILLKKELL
ncbi:MAG: 1-deoxy-D-xylulose-5-phosphate reductoisomerase [Candidatus Aminicenantes bacterium]|nr:1-deoxy-D-xylulose-5-phosphate reductoisomerase [Candidatus Aminicenantes bacterium]